MQFILCISVSSITSLPHQSAALRKIRSPSTLGHNQCSLCHLPTLTAFFPLLSPSLIHLSPPLHHYRDHTFKRMGAHLNQAICALRNFSLWVPHSLKPSLLIHIAAGDKTRVLSWRLTVNSQSGQGRTGERRRRSQSSSKMCLSAELVEVL